MRIRNDSHDLSIPTRDDVLSELNEISTDIASRFIPKHSQRLTDMWLRMVQVSDVLGDVLQLHYRIKGPDPTEEEVNEMSRKIDEMRPNTDLNEQEDDALHIHGLQIELLYQ